MNRFVDKTFIKFVLVGIINTLFGTTIMFGFYNILHCNYWFASAANYVLGSVLSYFLNKHFTFRNTTKGWKPILRFIINISVCYLLAYGIAKPVMLVVLQEYNQSIQENGAMIVGMVLFVCLNYIGQRYFAFKKQE